MQGGVFSLGDFTITTAAVYVGDPVTDLDGMLAATVQLRFDYVSGGIAVRAYTQTSLDQGTTWIDIACVLFGTAAERAVLNFSKLTPQTTQIVPTDGALPDDTTHDGILGDRLRLKLVSSGIYSGSTVLSARVAVS